MPNPSIPEEVKKRIEKDANSYSRTPPGYFGYIAGATAEAARAEELVNAVDILLKMLPHGEWLKSYYARGELNDARAALEKFKTE